MRLLDTVTEAAKSLSLLDETGKLIELDSLGALDLVAELERVLNIAIPAEAMQPEIFASLASVSQFLESLPPKA